VIYNFSIYPVVHFYSNFWSLGQSNRVSQNVQGDVARAGAIERRAAQPALTRGTHVITVSGPHAAYASQGCVPRGSAQPKRASTRAPWSRVAPPRACAGSPSAPAAGRTPQHTMSRPDPLPRLCWPRGSVASSTSRSLPFKRHSRASPRGHVHRRNAMAAAEPRCLSAHPFGRETFKTPCLGHIGAQSIACCPAFRRASPDAQTQRPPPTPSIGRITASIIAQTTAMNRSPLSSPSSLTPSPARTPPEPPDSGEPGRPHG
jgi:hypothetical protein